MNDVEQWLQDLGLGAYAQAFAEQGIEFDLLADLGDEDLRQLGVAALGHRKRMLRSIAELQGAAPTPAPRAAPGLTARDAERRHLTVMFCDLVGSTALAARLDPEDLQHLLRDYHQTVAQAVAPFDGHIAQFLGDGVLVYFGYPHAHEDDALRAVRSAVGVVQALVARRARGAHGGPALETRIGIATGLVVIGEIGTGTTAAERSASGETPNLAARMQSQAQPGEILLAEETCKLVADSFVLEPLGALTLKGFGAPVEAWRVVTERSVATRFEAQHMQGLVEFIGRDSEVALLLDRWALARDGEGQVVLLTGEAGIGKSRICLALRDRLAGESVATVLLQCSPYFNSSALYPVLQHLERMAGLAATDSPEVRAHKVEQRTGVLPASSLGCLLRLMGLPDGGRAAPRGTSPQEERTHTLEALIELLHHLCEQQPVLLLLEDAHWIDPSTEELIARVVQLARNTRLLLLVTSRPEYVPSWGHAELLTRLSLNRLSNRQCAALASAVAAGKALPDEVLAEILHKTDGIPLFVEELTKTVLQSGLLEDTPAGYRLSGPLPALTIPSTLQDSLMARLDRVAPAKEIAQVGAVIGREFEHWLLAEVLSDMPSSRLEAALADLVHSALVFRRGTGLDATYSFKHALVRDAAYNSMLKSQRVLRHGQIAAALEHRTATRPEVLAHHHHEGGNAAAALRWWQAAGDQAFARSAVREAVTHYQAAAALFDKVQPEQATADVELGLRFRLGSALVQEEGFTSPRVREAFTRARDLAALLDRPDDHLMACSTLSGCLAAIGRRDEALAMLEQFEPAELERVNPGPRAVRLARIGYLTMFRGELAAADDHLARAMRAFEKVSGKERLRIVGVDPQVATLWFLRTNLSLQGRLSAADRCAREALAIAEQRQNQNSRVLALAETAAMANLKGDWTDSIKHCSLALELAERYGLKVFGSWTRSAFGGALVATGQLKEGMQMLRDGYLAWTALAGVASTVYAADAADALLDAGCRDEAVEFMRSGEKFQHETGEVYQAALFLSMRGRLAQLDGDAAAAEASYRRAIETAQQQGALLYALRAATALTQLCQSQGRAGQADAMLQTIYEKFTEGFEYPDLIRARAVHHDV